MIFYRWILRLLPPSAYTEDADEMVWVFGELLREADGFWARTRLCVRVFGRLPSTIVLEWRDALVRTDDLRPGAEMRRRMMSSWTSDFRLAVRSLRKAPTFTGTSILLVGLGIGSVTSIFTVVDHLVLRALPYPAADRLVSIENGAHPGPVFRELQEKVGSVEMWGARRTRDASLVGEGDPLKVREAQVSREFFALYGARAGLGRLFAEGDYVAPNVAVLSPGVWHETFGSDPQVVGRTIHVDGSPLIIVGILDESFLAPEGSLSGGTSDVDIWRPLDWSDKNLSEITYWALDVTGRLARGRTMSELSGELEQVSRDLAQTFPDERVDEAGNPIPLPPARLQDLTTRRVRSGLELLLGAVGLLLLVACLNLAHLFLARGLGRTRDMALRRVLGAGTSSLVQQLLAESLLVGTLGGALGMGLAALCLRSFLSLNPTSLPWTQSISLDMRVLAFAAAMSIATALLFGLVPALRSVRPQLAQELGRSSRTSTAGRSASGMRGALVVTEVALSVVLLSEAGLLTRSFTRLQAEEPGFQVDGLWTVPLSPTGMTTAEEYRVAMEGVEASLAGVPGVVSAAYGLSLPFQFTGGGRCCWSTGSVEVDGERTEGLRVFLRPVTAGWFETLRLPLVAGRSWTRGDMGGEPWPVVLSEGFAVRLFGSAEGALNRVFTAGRDGTRIRALGVARDDRHYGLDQAYEDVIYVPVEELPWPIDLAGMVVRVDGEPPSGFARRLREAVWKAMPNLPVPTVRSMGDWVRLSTAGPRFDSALLGAFGVMALILATAGLYGTLLYNVGQRRRELGIRIALGADRRRVEGSVVRSGLAFTWVGCALGLVGALGAGRLLRSRLFDLTPADPLTLSGAVLVLSAVAMIASWLPARRAASVDPMEVLRE